MVLTYSAVSMNAFNPTKRDPDHWILLRGLTRETRHWGGFGGQLATALPGSRVIALDLPGNGQLHQQRSAMHIHDMVQSCRVQLRARNINPPYRVLAMSLGAMVSVAWSHSHPKEVATQVLINTSLRRISPVYERLRPANYGTLLKLAAFGASPETWERTILQTTSNLASDVVLPLWVAWRKANPVSRANALRQLLAAVRFCGPRAQPEADTLLLASAQDRLVSVACSKALAKHWQCDLRIHPRAGHDLPLDDGPWVADQVRRWLDN